MRVKLPLDEAQAEPFLPEKKADGSGVGINYADALLKPVKLTLPDGRKLAVKRRGLKLTLAIGDTTGDGLLRRLQHGPEVKAMVREALREAARNAGAEIHFEDGSAHLEA
ncbi:MAG TPA: hypothetical protein VML54_17730 [Candidatus Limnocylindrales bacterium]|nr:hypothetical protein [Candidatus Limnocylindrales bacterium]